LGSDGLISSRARRSNWYQDRDRTGSGRDGIGIFWVQFMDQGKVRVSNQNEKIIFYDIVIKTRHKCTELAEICNF
jgi:hypothetical protein